MEGRNQPCDILDVAAFGQDIPDVRDLAILDLLGAFLPALVAFVNLVKVRRGDASSSLRFGQRLSGRTEGAWPHTQPRETAQGNSGRHGGWGKPVWGERRINNIDHVLTKPLATSRFVLTWDFGDP